MPSIDDYESITSTPEAVRNLGATGDSHDAILQFLNRVIGDLFFPQDSFVNTVDQWNGIPIVFASEHPDLKAFDDDRDKELARIGGVIVGDVQHAVIVTVGHPRLMSQLRFTDGGKCSQYILQGKLSLSTGFWCRTKRNSETGRTLVGDVKPNHVLVFVEDLKNQPKDQGSIILNKEERKYCHLKKEAASLKEAGEIVENQQNPEQITDKGKIISAKNSSRLQKVIDQLKAVFGAHQEAIKDMDGLFAEMTGGGKEVNGDYHSVLPPTGPTDQPEAFAAGKQPVGNDMLKDATGYPPVGGMIQTAMKKAEPSASPSPAGGPADQKKVENMDDATKKSLNDMGYKTDDWNDFLVQVKALQDEKTALTDRIKGKDTEIANLKAQVEKFTKKLEQKKQKIANMKFEEFVNKLPKGMYPKTEEAKAQLRKEWEEDRDAVTNKVLSTAKGFKPGTQEQGITNGPAAAPEQSQAEIIEAIKNKKARGIGVWNPETRKYED